MLLKLLGTVAEQGGSVAVRIGHENPYAGLQTTSMVTTGYGAGTDLVAGPRRRRARPAWTTPRRWRPCAPSRPTSRGSSPSRPLRRPAPTTTPTVPKDLPPVNDYYADLGVARDASRGGHQARLPQGRPALHPDVNPGAGGRGAVQEGLAGLRRALRPREAAVLRHGLRPLRRRRRGLRPGLLVQRHHGRLLRRPGRHGRARPALAHHARPGRPRAARHRPRRRRLRGPEGPHHRHRGRVLAPASATACSRAPRPAPATSAPGAARSSRCSAASSARS